MNTASAPQQKPKLLDAAIQASVRDGASGWLGGTAKPGWSPRKGRRLSPFLGASRVGIRPISCFFHQSI